MPRPCEKAGLLEMGEDMLPHHAKAHSKERREVLPSPRG